MKKLLVVLLMISLLLSANTAYAGYVMDSNGKYVLSEDSYTEDGKIKVYSLWDRYSSNVKLEMELPKIDMSIPKLTFAGADDKMVEGVVTYPNYNDIKPGNYELQWVFTPRDDKYETINGVLSFKVWPEDSEASKGKLPDPEPERPTTPSLTATTLLLASRTAYDINLNNKVTGASYKWTSSNDKVAKVNPKNGLVTAVSEGTATITCAMTFPDGSAQELTSVVSINYDDNPTILSDTALDLDIGDNYTLKVENAPAGAKYKFVSSDKSIVKVGTANGKITAVSSGDAYITCTITADNQVIVLRCDVSVSE